MTSSADVRAIVLTDDGTFPNNYRVALTLYPGAFGSSPDPGEIETYLKKCGWQPAWRYGIYPYHHFHSTAHEFLACYSGSARVIFGGDKGQALELATGDAVLVPAGVAHKCLSSSNFAVVGAYPKGQAPDMNYGRPGERPKADLAIEALGLPPTDPVTGLKWPDFHAVIS